MYTMSSTAPTDFMLWLQTCRSSQDVASSPFTGQNSHLGESHRSDMILHKEIRLLWPFYISLLVYTPLQTAYLAHCCT